MTRAAWVWTLTAGLGMLWTTTALVAGGGLLIPVLVTGVALVCIADGRARERIEGWTARAFTGGAWRHVLIVAGAMILIQLLPYELALLAAGDVLAYVEVMTAVGLIAARTRVAALPALAIRLVKSAGDVFRRNPSRTPRAIRPRRRPSATSAPDEPAWGFA